MTELTEWFKAHTVKEFAHGRVQLVEPRIVIEVTFDRVQESRRHKSGYARFDFANFATKNRQNA